MTASNILLAVALVVISLLLFVTGLLTGVIIMHKGTAAAAESRRRESVRPAADEGSPEEPPAADDELERLRAARAAFEAEQKAFTNMLHYNVNDVYGAPSLEEIERRSKGGDS